MPDIKVTTMVSMGQHQTPWIDVQDYENAEFRFMDDWLKITVPEGGTVYFGRRTVLKLEVGPSC